MMYSASRVIDDDDNGHDYGVDDDEKRFNSDICRALLGMNRGQGCGVDQGWGIIPEFAVLG